MSGIGRSGKISEADCLNETASLLREHNQVIQMQKDKITFLNSELDRLHKVHIDAINAHAGQFKSESIHGMYMDEIQALKIFTRSIRMHSPAVRGRRRGRRRPGRRAWPRRRRPRRMHVRPARVLRRRRRPPPGPARTARSAALRTRTALQAWPPQPPQRGVSGRRRPTPTPSLLPGSGRMHR